MRHIAVRTLMAAAMVLAALALGAKSPRVAPSYAWELTPPLGLHREATIDTLLYNYYEQAIPSARSRAYATTGNIFSPGMDMVYMERKPTSDFFMRDALSLWLPSLETQKFYNTRIPMTLLSYNFGGGRENGQDRLNAVFSGNASRRWQVGAMIDYVHSKGSYAYQAAKNLTWGASASYMGDRYELQAFMYHYNNLCMDNGGITDLLYITDPAQLQGGKTSIDPKSIPTRLETARSRIRGTQFYVNNRYKVGYWHEEEVQIDEDSTATVRTYIPVTSFIYTLDYRESKYRFDDSNSRESSQFWDKTYFNALGTHDLTKYWSLRNTLGVDMIEGFHRLAKFGLAAFATYEVRRYTQAPYTFSTAPLAPGLDAFPYDTPVAPQETQSMLSVGAQLTKQRGSILTYEATGELGIIGAKAGDVDASAVVSTRIPLLGDTLAITGRTAFSNTEAPYLLKHFVSNHLVWENDFGKERRLRFGGSVTLGKTGTSIDVATETVQNLVYFGPDCRPHQHSGGVQVFSASLRQNLGVGPLHWNNAITFQTSADGSVLPMPKLVVYSNLYLLFRVARVLHVQMGIDCDYYTRYRGVSYQPATMSFYNPNDLEVGNYPFCNLYFNMKLSKTRFYIMWSHFNQGMFGGKNYFSMPYYPLNPRRFQLGVSVDFAN